MTLYSRLFLFFLCVISLAFTPVKASTIIDSLISEVEVQPKANLPALYMDLFVASRHMYDSALFFAQRASDIALELGDSLNYSRAEYALGYLYKGNGNFQAAIRHYERAYEIAKRNQFIERQKSALNGLALTYYLLSKFDLSLRYHFESLKIREEEGDLKGISVAVNNTGLVYYQLSDFKKALIYFERSRQIEEELGLESIFGTYVNLGLTNAGLPDYAKALEYFELALAGCSENCNPLIIAEANEGIGLCLRYLDGPGNPIDYYFKALEVAKSNELVSKLPSIYNGVSNAYVKENKYELAIQYLDSSQNIAMSLRMPLSIKNNFKDYAEINYKLEDFKKAYEYQVLYDSVGNEILNEVMAKNLLQIQVDFEERQNLEIIDLQNQEIGRRTTLLILSIASLMVIALGGFLLYKNNKVRRRVNEKLTSANEIIEKQNKKLTDLNTRLEERVKERTDELNLVNKELMKSNSDLDNFIYKTSHDIRGPLATLQGICNIALMDIKDPMAVDYFQKLSKTAFKLNRILSKLLIVNQINNSIPSVQTFNLNTMLNEVIEENQLSFVKKKIDVSIDGDENLNVESDLEIVSIILSNLVNNAFKFYDTSGNVTSFIKISYRMVEDGLVVDVIDNGVGISEDIRYQIFDIFSKTSEVQDSPGIGLYLVKLATDKLEGSIDVIPNDDLTIFRVFIPQ